MRPDKNAVVTGEVLYRMTYTRTVVREILRFRPPAPMVPQVNGQGHTAVPASLFALPEQARPAAAMLKSLAAAMPLLGQAAARRGPASCSAAAGIRCSPCKAASVHRNCRARGTTSFLPEHYLVLCAADRAERLPAVGGLCGAEGHPHHALHHRSRHAGVLASEFRFMLF